MSLFTATAAWAQNPLPAPVIQSRSEVSIVLGSGMFSLAGKAATSNTGIAVYDGQNTAAFKTYNPYGKLGGPSYGVHVNFKRISPEHLIFGLEAGIEVLRSKVAITRLLGTNTTGGTYRLDATGQSFLNFRFLNFAPFIGYRHLVKGVNVDVTTGLDLGYCLNVHEQGKATDANGNQYEINRGTHSSQSRSDIRYRTQLSASYHRFGTYVGYSLGLSNYLDQAPGTTSNCKSRLVRFGLSYRINKI